MLDNDKGDDNDADRLNSSKPGMGPNCNLKSLFSDIESGISNGIFDKSMKSTPGQMNNIN